MFESSNQIFNLFHYSLGFFTPRRPISMGDDLSWTTSSSSSCHGDDTDALSVPSTPSDSSGLRVTPLRHSMSMTSLRSGDDVSISPWNSPETKVVKVAMETSDSHYTNYYKCIIVSFTLMLVLFVLF